MNVEIEVVTEVDAPAHAVWEVLAAPESWPRWTDSMDAVDLLDGGDLDLGARARIVQPRMRPAVWTVTHLEPGVSFTWQSRVPGVTTTGTHTVTPVRTGRSLLTLGLQQSGPLAPLVHRLVGARTRRYMEQEAAGIRQASAAAALARREAERAARSRHIS